MLGTAIHQREASLMVVSDILNGKRVYKYRSTTDRHRPHTFRTGYCAGLLTCLFSRKDDIAKQPKEGRDENRQSSHPRFRLCYETNVSSSDFAVSIELAAVLHCNVRCLDSYTRQAWRLAVLVG